MLPDLTAEQRDRLEDARAEPELPYGKQPCLQCGHLISDIAGSKAAICGRCGFKDPCC